MAVWSRDKFKQLSKGFLGRRKNCFMVQVRGVFKSLQYQYIWRRLRRREVKKENIISINAATRTLGVNYSYFIYGLNRSNIQLDRKILSDLAQNEPLSFKAVFDEVNSQVKLPLNQNVNLKPFRFVPYTTALEKGDIYPGPYVSKNYEHKYARTVVPLPGQKDYFGMGHPDYPKNLIEEEKNYKAKFLTSKQQKKFPDTLFDDHQDGIEDDDPVFEY